MHRFKMINKLMCPAALALAFIGAGEALATTENLYSFGDAIGQTPNAAPTQAPDGSFYGTTYAGGISSRGSIYHMLADGTLKTIALFDLTNGAKPASSLVLARDGNWYGTASAGGATGAGTVFRVTPAGELSSLFSFDIATTGSAPIAGLLLGADGYLYGSTSAGGANNLGTLFKISLSGAFTTLLSFDGTNGADPQQTLTMGSDSYLYGTTRLGGTNNLGTIFKVSTSGVITTLYNFDDRNGAYPASPLTLAKDGNLYGTTSQNDAKGNKYGTAYKISTAGKLTTLARFNRNTGITPSGVLTQAADGNFYGVTHGPTTTSSGASASGTLFRMTTKGELTTLGYFTSAAQTGAPADGVIQASDGKLYGVTRYGGTLSEGAIYRADTAGNISVAASFAPTYSNGVYPYAQLIQGSDGNFYGTTTYGGTAGEFGTVFKITPSGALTTMASFNGANGNLAIGSLIQAADGNFYGTTDSGGSYSYGNVFRMTPNGALSSLASFDGVTNGLYADASLTVGPDGALYSTTCGNNSSTGSFGTVFKVTTSGVLTTLAAFDGVNGSCPETSVTLAGDGNFYGTTYLGGAAAAGTVYRMDPNGVITLLASFDPLTTGSFSYANLVVGSDGNLYGLNASGGAYSQGTMFRVGLDGSVTTVVTFDGLTNGGQPYGALVPDGLGGFYGSTTSGGALGFGGTFHVTIDGTMVALDSFDGVTALFSNGVTAGRDGSLYGTSLIGGDLTDPLGIGGGNVFKYTP